MGAILVGLFIAFLIGSVIFMIGLLVDDCLSLYCDLEWLIWLVTWILIVITTVGSIFTCISYDVNSYKKWILKYSTQKEMIENVIAENKLSDLERVDLLSNINSLNNELLDYQYDCQQWYGFTIDKEVLELEPIEIK